MSYFYVIESESDIQKYNNLSQTMLNNIEALLIENIDCNLINTIKNCPKIIELNEIKIDCDEFELKLPVEIIRFNNVPQLKNIKLPLTIKRIKTSYNIFHISNLLEIPQIDLLALESTEFPYHNKSVMFPNIKNLFVEDPNFTKQLNYSQFPNLKNLNIIRNEEYDYSNLTSLETLSIKSVFNDLNILQLPPNLKVLQIKGHVSKIDNLSSNLEILFLDHSILEKNDTINLPSCLKILATNSNIEFPIKNISNIAINKLKIPFGCDFLVMKGWCTSEYYVKPLSSLVEFKIVET